MDNAHNVTQVIELGDLNTTSLYGSGDAHLKFLEQRFPEVAFFARGNELALMGAPLNVAHVERVIKQLVELVRAQGAVSVQDIQQLTKAHTSQAGGNPSLGVTFSDAILTVRGRQVRPQTERQREYVRAIEQHTVTFGIGPAGTGKTYLAMAMAVQALQRRDISRIILTRPAVEAGERLGYLPGTLEEKIDPYLRPLFDAVGSMLEPEAVTQLLTNGTIEVAPLAYMRGRTLNEAFVILDEAQNTTAEQMKMFLTRLGYGSKMVITGDITQVDLPHGPSGLKIVSNILKGVDDIAFITLTSDDIVRHSLVGRIVDAYETYEADNKERNR